MSQFSWELLVIDNGSDSDCRAIHRACAEAFPSSTYHYQEEAGLSAARNKGVALANGQFICFFDDDALVSPRWFSAAAAFFFNHPKVGVIGGPIQLQYSANSEWDRSAIARNYLSAFDKGPDPVALHYNEYPRGANMAFRAEVLAAMELFSLQLGRNGNNLLSYEEIELCYRIEKSGQGIFYVPELLVTHLIQTNRLSDSWLEKRAFYQGKSEAIFDQMHRSIRQVGTRSLQYLFDLIFIERDKRKKGYLLQVLEHFKKQII